MMVQSFLENSALSRPDNKAVWLDGVWHVYSEIEESANVFGNYLIGRGVRRGDRVALLFRNSVDYIIAYFGILKAGAVAVSLSTESRFEQLEYLLRHSDSIAVAADTKYMRYLLPALREVSSATTIVLNKKFSGDLTGLDDREVTYLPDLLTEGDERQPIVRGIDLDLAEIVYTSGSTGEPKGVMLTHLNLSANMHSIAQYLQLGAEDRQMVVLPFYYIYGKSLLLSHFLAGGSLVVDNRFMYPNTVLETMRDMKVTGFAGVPSTYAILLNRSAAESMTFPALRYLTQAGGAMAPSLQIRVAEVFSPAKLYIMYGATEAAPRLSYLHPDMLERKTGSIGLPVPNVELQIHDENGNIAPTGETGEIVARGSNIMAGYWKDQDGTVEAVRNGFYYTGDLGKQDKEGYFYVVGRSRDIIKVKGFRVSTREIEDAILEHECVHEAAVTGVDDPLFGEAPKAYIVLKDGWFLDADELETYLKEKLPVFKIPKYIVFKKSLPKSGAGKILKNELS